MVSKLNVLVKEVYEQKIRSQRAELKQLQSQVNPHFLYNSYFVLYRLAKIPDVDNVLRMARHLGEYFRFITRSRSDEVTLEEELKHTLAYIQIQMYRFDQRVETYCEEQGFIRTSLLHREIYLSDPRRVEPAKMKTVLRFPVRKS